MEFLSTLWLPILLSAVFVFLASSVIHMALGYHRTDYGKLPDEDKVLDALRSADTAPGNYTFPYMSSMQEMGSPEGQAKFQQGPVGFVTFLPNGPIAMGKALIQWFLYCVLISVFVAYLGSLAVADDMDYMAVFRITGTIAVLGYAFSNATNSIWKGERWSTTFKFLVDGLIYGLVTAGTFAWLWPSA